MTRCIMTAAALMATLGVAIAQTSTTQPQTQGPGVNPSATGGRGLTESAPRPGVAPGMGTTGAGTSGAAADTTTQGMDAQGMGATTGMGAPHGMGADAGIRMGDTATVAVKFLVVQPASFMASKLMGVNVYNNQNETLGEIEDLVIDNGKTIKAVIVSVGGFLGLGESYVALDPASIAISQKGGGWRAYVDTSKDNLRAAPKFNYTKVRS